MTNAPRLGVGVAIVRDGRLLLIRRLKPPEAGCWSLPGGKVDFLETVEAALRREAREELGVDLGPLSLLCVTDQLHPDIPEHWVAPVYLAREFVGEPAIQEPDKHDGLEWYGLDDLPAPLTLGTLRAVQALKSPDSSLA
ncbi:MAG: NUDIX domain-containing protein [Caulobacter sp.]|nr:NUDIX domain-containing protein [Caulobacter sp.]